MFYTSYFRLTFRQCKVLFRLTFRQIGMCIQKLKLLDTIKCSFYLFFSSPGGN